ncbi:MAG: hypothetical protein L3V56_09510 [Candidatus Magnetoovum sp. WYHC-5]|nr:hypothetical protein [Candidatus Magnetoovum sp. WYHC-5]
MFSMFTTTGIGSLPHIEPSEACKLILESVDIPFWPQLPKAGFRQSMIAQYSEDMPFLRLDVARERVWFEREDEGELSRFYEKFIMPIGSPISSEFANGFYEMENMVSQRRFSCFKGHVTGPLTFTLDIKESNGRFLYFDEELREVALMLLEAKARWQIERLRAFADNVVIFIDEPMLSALGSSVYLGVSQEETGRLLASMIERIKNAGAIVGIHCCGKADWELVFDSKPDIVNFDSYSYFNTIVLYHEKIRDFIEGGGWLSWGSVPTGQEIKNEDFSGVWKIFMDNLDSLGRYIDIKTVVQRSMLTPSCGTGGLTVEEAKKVFAILKQLKSALVDKFC